MEERKPVWNHLDDLRKVLIRSVIALFVTSSLSFLFADFLLAFLLHPYQRLLADHHTSGGLMTLEPTEAFMMSMRLALISGAVLALPLLVRFIWQFVAAGLYPKERKIILPILYTGTVLFIVGSLFAFYFVVPTALDFFWGYNLHLGLTPAWTISHYLGFVLTFLLAFGLAFELPMLVVGATRLGFVSTAALSASRPYVIVGIFIVGAILTPPNVLSQLALSLPMWGLFELSLLVSRWGEKTTTRCQAPGGKKEE